MTNRRVHIASFLDQRRDYIDPLLGLSSFLFCHIINSLERFILFRSRAVTVSEHSPKELNTLFSHSPIQITALPNHEYLHFKTITNLITQTRCRKGRLCRQGYLKTQNVHVDYY